MSDSAQCVNCGKAIEEVNVFGALRSEWLLPGDDPALCDDCIDEKYCGPVVAKCRWCGKGMRGDEAFQPWYGLCALCRAEKPHLTLINNDEGGY